MSSGRVPDPLPAAFLRGGTSKGIYVNRAHLPASREEWGPIFLGLMGSPDPEHGRQLNGMGGGISSLSKICVVGEPSAERRTQGIDVDYTFCQVGIRDTMLDYSGNCGNLSSMIGVFAVDEGLCSPRKSINGDISLGTVRSFNLNTSKRIDTTFPVDPQTDRALLNLPQTLMAGVPGKASEIVLDFVSPSGARTGSLTPTGSALDRLTLGSKSVRASLIDATNPSVLIHADELRFALDVDPQDPLDLTNPLVLQALESLRQQGAVLMGLDPSAQAQPKIAVLSQPDPITHPDVDIDVHALSMGVLHKAVPMTLGLCVGVACSVENSLAWEVLRKSRAIKLDAAPLIRIRHPSGVVDVGADVLPSGEVTSAKVVRTGRRLMKGEVYWSH